MILGDKVCLKPKGAAVHRFLSRLPGALAPAERHPLIWRQVPQLPRGLQTPGLGRTARTEPPGSPPGSGGQTSSGSGGQTSPGHLVGHQDEDQRL